MVYCNFIFFVVIGASALVFLALRGVIRLPRFRVDAIRLLVNATHSGRTLAPALSLSLSLGLAPPYPTLIQGGLSRFVISSYILLCAVPLRSPSEEIGR